MKLFEVQRAALKASAGKGGFAYYMQQGLGKTLTALADFTDQVANGNASRLVVGAPNSFKTGWIKDAEKHGVDLDFFVWDASSKRYFESWVSRGEKGGWKRPPALIINYEAIRNPDVQEQIKRFAGGARNGSFLVWDESIQLKTYNSAQTKAAINIAKEFNFKRLLSGKPITQGPHDIWGQFRSAGLMNGRQYHPFKTAFCKMGGFKNKQVVGAQNEDLLAELIDPYIFWARKVDWTDLPPKLYTTREYTMTPEMKAMYKEMQDEFVLYLSDTEHVAVDAAITKYIKLAQIQCGFIIDEERNVRWLVEDSKNPRLNALLEIVETELEGKAIIPYVNRPVFDLLMRSPIGNRSAYIKGGMTGDEVEEQKRRFNDDPNCQFMLLQHKAGKYGHTLLGDQSRAETTCSTTIFFQNTYSLDDRDQVEDRNHRHGQEAASVLYIDLAGTPLDREAARALQRKEDVFQAVFRHITQTSG